MRLIIFQIERRPRFHLHPGQGAPVGIDQLPLQRL